MIGIVEVAALAAWAARSLSGTVERFQHHGQHFEASNCHREDPLSEVIQAGARSIARFRIG
jgi:hypothetical protein